MPRVNPEILRWARETAGLTPDEAVQKLKLNSARGVLAVDRLAVLESDANEIPSRALLVRMAKQYRRPLLAFYLSKPPHKGDRGQDFRTLPSDAPRGDDALLDALIRNVRTRQSIVRAVLEDEDEAELLPFIGMKKISDGVQSLVKSIEDTLEFTANALYEQSSPDEAFAFLRNKAEAAGVFVLLIGDLGSHHSRIDLQVFRGFALSDDVAPFVIINDQDSRSAWAFTLLHELVHLWLGQTGVSGSSVGSGIEQFCNDVASQFLLPDRTLSELSIVDEDSLADRIGAFAGQRNLSRSMVSYRLYRAGTISRRQWQLLSSSFRQEWLLMRERRRARDRQSSGGPNYYVVRGHRNGRALLDLVGRMVSAGALTTSKAGLVLGVKAKQVPTILRPNRGRASSPAV